MQGYNPVTGTVLPESALKTRFLFTGREHLPSARLYDYRHRTYSPTLGRFLQSDPIRFSAGDVNLYRYDSNKPGNSNDPLGLWGIGGGDSSGNVSWNIGWGDPTFLFIPKAGGELVRNVAATADGVVLFIDPFANRGVYDPTDPLHQFSQSMGGIAQDAMLIAAIPNVGTWAKNPLMYEIGSSALPTPLFNAIRYLSPIDTGKFLVRAFGPKAAFIGIRHFGRALKLIKTGLTPGGWLAVIGIAGTLNNKICEYSFFPIMNIFVLSLVVLTHWSSVVLTQYFLGRDKASDVIAAPLLSSVLQILLLVAIIKTIALFTYH